MLTRSQEKMVEILLLLKEIPEFKDKKLDEQQDTIHMSKLESEESAEQKGISIAQSKARNDSKKL